MSNDNIGDRMKLYEGATTDQKLMSLLPICVRIDGRAFHTFTANMKRPFEPRLSRLMIDVTRKLVEETGAAVGYTQSDEISLVIQQEDVKDQVYFDGRIQKLQSVLASLTTAIFNAQFVRAFDDAESHMRSTYPTFDCRVWNVPTREEATNYLLWREQDATKNSITMAARAVFGHHEIEGKNGNEKKEMLRGCGVVWDEYPAFFKRGTFVQRHIDRRPFSAEDLAKLPPKHHAHSNPGLVVERQTTRELEMPPFGRVRNRQEVIFEKASPIVGDHEDIPPPPGDPLTAKLQRLLYEAVRRYMGLDQEKGDLADEGWLDEALEHLGLDRRGLDRRGLHR